MMANSRDRASQSDATAQIQSLVRLPALAEELGLKVVNPSADSQTKALCPFHNDIRPSLSFFRDKSRRWWRYQCFSCGERGDVFTLIEKLRNTDFLGAREWLAARFNVRLPGKQRQGKRDLRREGLAEAWSIYQSETSQESAEFDSWSENQRGFNPAFLRQAGARFANTGKLTSAAEEKAFSREVVEALLAGGVLRPSFTERNPTKLPLVFPVVDHFNGPRIVFSIRDSDGGLAGFAGRAVKSGQDPKYLYTLHFPRGSTLYRLEEVKKQLMARRRTSRSRSNLARDFQLFVVEGLLDALRLESLGMPAVALLGNQATAKQLDLLAALAEAAENAGQRLVISLFLDRDEAGRAGSRTSLVRLLRLIASHKYDWCVRVTDLRGSDGSKDADEFLRNVGGAVQANDLLSQLTVSPLRFLLAAELDCPSSDLPNNLAKTARNDRGPVFRSIERLLDEPDWRTLFERQVPLFDNSDDAWKADLETYLRSAIESRTAPTAALPAVEFSGLSRYVHAARLARCSRQRREFPFDEGGWNRFEAAISVLQHIFDYRFAQNLDSRRSFHESGRKALIEPMLAVVVPKANGKRRLKALPCQEDLTMQQVVLNEVLKSQEHDLGLVIPAVRYYRSSAAGFSTRTTGCTGLETDSSAGNDFSTVAFAYQLEMDVIDGRTPPRLDGMFRPYIECWRAFVDYLRLGVRALNGSLMYVDRLDVSQFYDRLPRYSVRNVLMSPMRALLRQLGPVGSPLISWFGKKGDVSELIADRVTDWLCDQSFGYEYCHPGTGDTTRGPNEDIGVPQGPDLSAYLANIALFPVDSRATTAIRALSGNGPPQAVYARYVDDIVLVATSDQSLRRLREQITGEVSRIGLELSKKDEPLPPLRKEHFDDWVTDRRGGGLSVSGDFGPLLIHDPPDDIEISEHVMSRTDALTLLHDPELIEPGDIARAVHSARRVNDLRSSDLVVAVRRLWLAVGQSSDVSGKSLCDRIWDMWRNTEPARLFDDVLEEEIAWHNSQPAMLILEGLDRFLLYEPAAARVSDSVVRRTAESQEAVAHAIVRDALIDAVWDRRGTGSHNLKARSHALRDSTRPEVDREIGHSMRVRALAIVQAAHRVLRTPNNHSTSTGGLFRRPLEGVDAIESAVELRFLFSAALAARMGLRNDTSLVPPNLSGNADRLLLMFNEAITRLRLFSLQEDTQGHGDPLNPLIVPWRDEASHNPAHPLVAALKSWWIEAR